MKNQLTVQNSGLFGVLLPQIAVALTCLLAYAFCLSFYSDIAMRPVCIPLTGMVLAAILIDQKKYLFGMFSGVLLAQYLYAGVPWWVCLFNSAGCGIEAWLGAGLLANYKKFEPNFVTIQSFLSLCLISTILPALGSVFLAVSVWMQPLSVNPAGFVTINQYWMGDSLGIILTTTFALLWLTGTQRWKTPSYAIETALFLLVSFLAGQIIFFDRFSAVFGSINRGYWMFLLVLVAAIRIGRRGVILIIIMTTIQALGGAATGRGFFGSDAQNTHLINLWNYVATLTLVGMVFAIILKSRLSNEHKLRKSEVRLRETQKLAELASWSWDVESDEHHWSPEIYEFYGRDPRLGPAVYPEVKQYFTEESWAQLAAAVERCLQSGFSYECDAEVIRQDKSRRWIIARGEVSRDESGKIVGLFGTVQDITVRKLAQLKVSASESNFRSLFEHSPTAMLAVDPASGRILQANENALHLWGYSSEEFVKMTMYEITFPEDEAASHVRYDALLLGELGNATRFEKRYLRKDGNFFWAEVSSARVGNEAGESVYNITSVIDITERKQIELQLLQLSKTVEQSPESIVITSIDAVIEYVNESYVRKSGYTRQELIGQNSRMVQSGKTPRSTYDAMWAALTRGEVWEGEFINRSKDGVEYTEHAIVSPIRQADGRVTHYVAVKEDITEKIRSRKQLHRLSYFDEITELPNSVMMYEQLNSALTQTRHNSSYGGVITFNIDRFKTINDANGQTAANVLLKAIADRLVRSLYTTDVVARMSGDEFCILFPDLADALQPAALLAMHVSQKIHQVMRQSFDINGKEFFLTACHGIALFTGTDEDNPHEIVRRANTAMHHAKLRGCEQSVFFESSLEQIVKQRFAIESELRYALLDNEFRIYLQSQVDAEGNIKGAEALIRWQHPQSGLISPVKFIPIAEETNLIIGIDNWMLTEVCRQLIRLKDLPIRISVNISARHFNQIDFVDQVRNILALTLANPCQLTLEITESVVIGNIDEVVAKMLELSALGLHFSMDDFGTGYSSLSYLKRLPIHELKIDKSFIQEVTSDSNDAALVEVILAVARHLNLRVVAEGVETPEQAGFLNQRAKVLHQGYLFSRPEPIEDWFARLAALQAGAAEGEGRHSVMVPQPVPQPRQLLPD